MADGPAPPSAWSEVERLLAVADHPTVVRWAWECASRAVGRFTVAGGDPGADGADAGVDPRLARALAHVAWSVEHGRVDEESHQAVVVGAHNAARALPDRTGARAAARAVAAVVATLRAPEHAVGVAMYGAMAARDAGAPAAPPDVAAADAERLVQRDRLVELLGYSDPPAPGEGVEDATWSPHTARAPESPTR